MFLPSHLYVYGTAPLRRQFSSVASANRVPVAAPPQKSMRLCFEDAQVVLHGPEQPSLAKWYRTRRIDIQRVNKQLASRIIHDYAGSMSAALIESFPEFNWQPWRFPRAPPGFWNDRKNRLQFMEYVALEKSISVWPDDWYLVDTETFRRLGGRPLLAEYQDSLVIALQDLYPNFDWEPWRFKKAPSNFWQNTENRRRLWISIGKKLGYSAMEDWYQISYDDVVNNGGATVLKNYHSSSINAALAEAFPDHNWQKWKFSFAQ